MARPPPAHASWVLIRSTISSRATRTISSARWAIRWTSVLQITTSAIFGCGWILVRSGFRGPGVIFENPESLDVGRRNTGAAAGCSGFTRMDTHLPSAPAAGRARHLRPGGPTAQAGTNIESACLERAIYGWQELCLFL